MNKVRTQVIAEHKFENFYVKLFEDDLALCNENGNEEMAIRYLDIEENVELIDKKHTVNNIIFGTLAAVFFGAALFLFGFAAASPIYMAVKDSLDLAIILTGIGFIIFGCLPLALGKWFAGLLSGNADKLLQYDCCNYFSGKGHVKTWPGIRETANVW